MKESTQIFVSVFIILIGAIFSVILSINFRHLGLNFFWFFLVVGLLISSVGFAMFFNFVSKELGVSTTQWEQMPPRTQGIKFTSKDQMPFFDWLVNEARKNFPTCPLCENDHLNFDSGNIYDISMTCENCNAKWLLTFSRKPNFWNPIYSHMYVELKKEADDGRGKELLGKKLEASKWKQMLLRTQYIICKFCGTIIKDETDQCKKCGRKIDATSTNP